MTGDIVEETNGSIAKTTSDGAKTIVLDEANHVTQGAEEAEIDGARDGTGLGGFEDSVTVSFKGHGSL